MVTMSVTGIIVSTGMRSLTQADISVSTKPGAIAVAVTPLPDSSAFNASTSDTTAAFDALYAARPASAYTAAIEASAITLAPLVGSASSPAPQQWQALLQQARTARAH